MAELILNVAPNPTCCSDLRYLCHRCMAKSASQLLKRSNRVNNVSADEDSDMVPDFWGPTGKQSTTVTNKAKTVTHNAVICADAATAEDADMVPTWNWSQPADDPKTVSNQSSVDDDEDADMIRPWQW